MQSHFENHNRQNHLQLRGWVGWVDHNDLIRCEVSGEAPLFQTATSSNVMIVVGRRKTQNKKDMLFFSNELKGSCVLHVFANSVRSQTSLRKIMVK